MSGSRRKAHIPLAVGSSAEMTMMEPHHKQTLSQSGVTFRLAPITPRRGKPLLSWSSRPTADRGGWFSMPKAVANKTRIMIHSPALFHAGSLMTLATYLEKLNPEQRRAVVHGAAATGPRSRPLLVIAGAGSGKTNTLAHRVAHLIVNGVDPRRILLMTFSRRAAAEMTLRVERICGDAMRHSVAFARVDIG